MTDMKTKIAEARAAREALEQSRAAKAAEVQLEDELAAELHALEEAQLVDKFESEHGPLGRGIAVVRTARGPIVVRRPNASSYRKFLDKGAEKFSTEGLEILTRPCVLHPSKAAFDTLIEELPHALIDAGNAVCELAGVRKAERSGK